MKTINKKILKFAAFAILLLGLSANAYASNDGILLFFFGEYILGAIALIMLIITAIVFSRTKLIVMAVLNILGLFFAAGCYIMFFSNSALSDISFLALITTCLFCLNSYIAILKPNFPKKAKKPLALALVFLMILIIFSYKYVALRMECKYGFSFKHPLACMNKYPENAVYYLNDAVRKENIELAKTLLAKGADINAKERHGWSPLLIALREHNMNFGRDNTEMVELLLTNGAEVNFADEYGNTALDLAVSDKMKQLLLQYGAKNGKDLQ